MSYKVLFVGGGRRLELARLFRELDFDVYSYEVDEHCPLTRVGKVIKGLSWDKCYEHLAATIQVGEFNLVLPLMDAAIPLLSVINEKEKHISNIIIPNVEYSALCWDKLAFEGFMLENFYIHYPKVYPYFDVLEKPRFGFGSRNIKEMPYSDYGMFRDEDNFVYQRYIDGIEYSVDCYVNKKGTCIGAVPRQRIEVTGGEVSKSKTIKMPNLEEISMRVAEHLQVKGPITIQWIVDNNSNIPYCIEANSRFCDGSPLSIEAGFNTVKFLVEEYIYDRTIVAFRPWRPNVYMCRSFESTYFNL